MSKHHIVVAYDFTRQADLALERGVQLVCGDPQQVLHFVTVIDSHQTYQTADRIRQDLLEQLRLIFQARSPGRDIEFFVHARLGNPAEEILSLAEEIGAELIIVGSHARSTVGRLLLGSVSEGVLHGARCTVVVARPSAYKHVELDKVTEVDGPHKLRPSPHRYSYSSDIAQVRSRDWPLG